MPPIDYTHLIAAVVGWILTLLYNRMRPPVPGPGPAPNPVNPISPLPVNPLLPGGLQIGNGQLLSLLLAALMAKPPQPIQVPSQEQPSQ
jgi:hypothetical protein